MRATRKTFVTASLASGPTVCRCVAAYASNPDHRWSVEEEGHR
jgi:hypothetical protein